MHVKRSCMLPKSGGSVAESGELSTRDLIALAQSGDRESFDPLYRRFAGRLMGYALVRARGNRPLAEDVTSEVWARIIAYIGSWEDRGGNVDHSFFGMLCAAVRQRLGQHYAARWRETCHGSLTADEEFDGGHLVNVAPIHDDDNTQDGPGELADRLRAVVDGLHLTARQVVQLRLDGLTNAQIAARLDMTGQRVNQVWQQAMRVLRLRVSDSFTDVAARNPERVRELAAMLPEPQNKVALLRLDGVPEREVAERLGMTWNAARRVWALAKDGIRRRLADPQYGRSATIQPQERRRLYEVAQTLPPAQRQVALLRLDGARNRDIARSLGVSQKAVTSRWIRARTAFVREGVLAPAA